MLSQSTDAPLVPVPEDIPFYDDSSPMLHDHLDIPALSYMFSLDNNNNMPVDDSQSELETPYFSICGICLPHTCTGHLLPQDGTLLHLAPTGNILGGLIITAAPPDTLAATLVVSPIAQSLNSSYDPVAPVPDFLGIVTEVPSSDSDTDMSSPSLPSTEVGSASYGSSSLSSMYVLVTSEHQKMKINDACKEFGVSRGQLSKRFKEASGRKWPQRQISALMKKVLHLKYQLQHGTAPPKAHQTIKRLTKEVDSQSKPVHIRINPQNADGQMPGSPSLVTSME